MATDKTIILITGANGGIGFLTAEVLAGSPKNHVVVGSRSVDKGKAAIAEIRKQVPEASVSTVQLDVTDEKSIETAAAAISKDFGRVDVLINNAGIISHKQTLIGQLRDTFETNAFGPAIVTETFLPLLEKSSGARLIYVSSGLGSINMRLDPKDMYKMLDGLAYRMSKAALNMLVAGAFVKYGPKGMKVWAFDPGYVVTNLSGTGEKGMQERRERGAGDPRMSANALASIVAGKRDEDVGKFVHENGIYPW